MRSNSLLIIGVLITAAGLVFLLSALLNISFLGICLPVAFILLGIWILLRPRVVKDNSDLRLLIFGDVKHRGVWQVRGEEVWLVIGDVRLDFSQAEIPLGETTYHVNAFISDIRLTIPEDVGVSISSLAFLNTVRLTGIKRDVFFVPFEYQSEGYADSQRKIRLETACFIADIRIKQLEQVSDSGSNANSQTINNEGANEIE